MNDDIQREKIGISPDTIDENRRRLAELVPEAFSEGRLDVEALKRTLGEDFVIEGGERYRLEWAGKSEAYKVLQTPTSATLRPERDKSINFDTADHVFIEGENLEVLKVLQKAYFGKVKLIYIDPPYNTGNDSFIYPDRFQESKEDYLKRVNELSDDGTLMREGFFRKNSRENGHYHSNWLNMMLPRLYIARNLLREDGVIFVSCDDNEVHNLRYLMNETFGEDNFVAQIVWKSRVSEDTRAKTGVSTDHEYIVCCRKSEAARLKGVEKDLSKFSNPDHDHRGPWRSADLTGLATRDQRPNLHFDLVDPETNLDYGCPPKGWRFDPRTMARKIAEQRILWPDTPSGRPRHKLFLEEMKSQFKNVSTVISGISTSDGTRECNRLIGDGVFQFPKPVALIKLLIDQIVDNGDIVVDFFAGSCPTAQAVLDTRIIDGRDAKFICVQLPEPVEKGTQADRNGFRAVSDLGRTRINEYLKSLSKSEDILMRSADTEGYLSFVLAPSNLKQWRGDGIETAEELAEQIQMFVKSEKDGARTDDLLYELLLRFGQELTTPVETLQVEGQPVFAIQERKMLFVLERFEEPMIDPLLELKPREIIALDSVFAGSDELKTNLGLQCRDAGIQFTCV